VSRGRKGDGTDARGGIPNGGGAAHGQPLEGGEKRCKKCRSRGNGRKKSGRLYGGYVESGTGRKDRARGVEKRVGKRGARLEEQEGGGGERRRRIAGAGTRERKNRGTVKEAGEKSRARKRRRDNKRKGTRGRRRRSREGERVGRERQNG